MKQTHGLAPIFLIVYIAAAGAVGLFVAKPKLFHGESKRAETSAKTTAELVATANQKSAEAAASIVVIEKANLEAPDSKQKEFIAREIPVALSKLQPPDLNALLSAEQRKASILEGRLEQADKLYGIERTHSADLENKYVKALAAKNKSDQDLQIVAAEHLVIERQRNQIIVVCGVLGLLYFYTKATHLGIGAVSELAKDLKDGRISSQHAIDSVTSRFQQFLCRIINKFKP